jgi:transketolase
LRKFAKQLKFRKMNCNKIAEEADIKKKIVKIQYFAQKCRSDVFEMLYKRGNGHWGGSASATELITTLYCHILNIDPQNPRSPDRDRLILGKGHAAPILYTLLAQKGYFPVEELKTFRDLNSRLQGHPCMNATPGVDLSTGPLGHGISVGLGLALGARLQKKKYWTFVMVGEGCLNEGESWEAIMSAGKFRPPRLVIMVDNNKVQLDGTSEKIMPLDPLPDKFRAFNLQVADRIYDGHSVEEIFNSWSWIQQHQEEPSVVIYRTHKGKGISFMEDNNKWHGSTIDEESYNLGRIELKTTLERLFYEYF